ncbi:MAG: DUF177 domain-containing protein [Candidatus Omnitrophica bacterium]|nr:DUF177 domain-containing protein [Candidatus Omnitrophota bacterium]
MMKIYVNRIPAEGLHEEAAYDPKVLDVERFDLRLEEPIAVSSVITKAENAILVQAQIRGRLRFSCARCLEPFALPLETAATLSYQVRPSDVVDITEDIRQEIILAYPMIPVCRPACKGLCPACGQNLNAGSCVHDATTAE